MARKLLASLLLISVVFQAWGTAGMPADSDPCVPGAAHEAPVDCCPDEASMGATCEAFCSAPAAFAAAAVAPVLEHSTAPLEVLPVARAGPHFVPLNPPPIA